MVVVVVAAVVVVVVVVAVVVVVVVLVEVLVVRCFLALRCSDFLCASSSRHLNPGVAHLGHDFR